MPRTGAKGARGATASLVPVRGTNRDQRVELVPVRATDREQWPCTAAWWWEFSPTSLAEREPHLFIIFNFWPVIFHAFTNYFEL